MAPSPIKPLEDDDPSSPVSYFTLEARKQSDGTLLGGQPMPKLPKTHWSNDPVPAEPTINREEDGDTIDINQER